MTVRHSLAVLFATIALMLSAGCGGGGDAPTVDETSDSQYRQAQDLKKQGRNGEALNAFLKVIVRRGESGAPESHLEAAALYLHHVRDPVEAYHHFRKYLELQPVGPRSDMVRGQVDAAAREFVKMRVGASGDSLMGPNSAEEVQQMRRRIQELEMEVQTLRGASAVPVVRSAPIIAMPEENAASPAAEPVDEIPITPAPQVDSPFVRGLGASANARAAISSQASVAPKAGPQPRAIAGERVPTTPTRPGSAVQSAAAVQAGRTHTVRPGEKSLWGIARRYYGSQVTGAQVQGIYRANRDTMRSDGDLRPGMVLRIP